MSTKTIGFSSEARFVDEYQRREQEHLRASQTFGLRSELREELADLWSECREANWDGFQGRAVPQDVLRNTYQLLETLPAGVPAPALGAEPDGQITLEWHRNSRRLLSVSVTPEGDLHYAALLGPSRVYGTEVCFGHWPRLIIDLIHKVCGQ